MGAVYYRDYVINKAVPFAISYRVDKFCDLCGVWLCWVSGRSLLTAHGLRVAE